MDKLNLPAASLKISADEMGRDVVFDIIRKRNVVITPEEWVRQHLIHFLLEHLAYPQKLIKVESGHIQNSMLRRTDIIAYDNAGNPGLIIECKSPEEPINQETFDQVFRYNEVVKARFVVVSNGVTHYCCMYDLQTNQYTTVDTIPDYNTIRI